MLFCVHLRGVEILSAPFLRVCVYQIYQNLHLSLLLKWSKLFATFSKET